MTRFQNLARARALSVDLSQRIDLEEISEARIYSAMLIDWAVIIASIYCGMQLPIYLAPLFVLIVGCQQHALLILLHEQVHFHLTKNIKLGEIISDLLLGLPLLISTELYRKTHYQHHSHINTKKDPDLKFMSEREEWQIPKNNRSIALMIFKDLSFFLHFKENFVNGPFVLLWSPLMRLFRPFHHPQGGLKFAYKIAIACYYAAAVCLITYFAAWKAVALFWLLPLVTVLPASTRIRALPEHLGLPEGDGHESSRTVWPLSFLEQFLFAPHKICVHQEHHSNPRIPYYNLTKAFETFNAVPDRTNQYESYLGKYGALTALTKSHSKT